MRCALVTCLKIPEPDPDEVLLMAALRVAGIEAALASWDDPRVDWRSFDLAVVRSTWNYHQHLDAFLAWIDRAAASTRLCNPAHVMRWNAHKGYLLELEARGLPIAPKALVR